MFPTACLWIFGVRHVLSSFSTHRILFTPIYVIVWIMSSISNAVLSLHINSPSHWSPFNDASVFYSGIVVSFYIFFQSLAIIFISVFFICLFVSLTRQLLFLVAVLLLPGAIGTNTRKRPMLVYYQQLECEAQDPNSTVADHTTSTILLGWKDELPWSSEKSSARSKWPISQVQGMAEKWRFRWSNFRKLEKHTVCLLCAQRDLSYAFQYCPVQLDWGHHGHICLTMRYNILRVICRLPLSNGLCNSIFIHLVLNWYYMLICYMHQSQAVNYSINSCQLPVK